MAAPPRLTIPPRRRPWWRRGRWGAAFIVASYLWLEILAQVPPTMTIRWVHTPAPGITHPQQGAP